MVSHNAIGSVNAINVLCAELASVRTCTAKLLDLDHERVEDIRVVVGQLVLEDGNDTLEAHASVHVFRRESFKGSVLLTVELDKDIIPDFDDCWVVAVNKMGNLTTTYSIDMYLAVMTVNMDYNE